MSSVNPFEKELRTWMNLFQDCNINFLIGSGLSSPFFGTLGKIEVWLTELENNTVIEPNLKDYIKASLYGSYYRVAMKDNINILRAKITQDAPIDKPKTQKDKLDLDLHFNDGFNGIFKKRFSLRNFKKSFYQKSLHYDNIAEIPVYNLLKIHGSVTWGLANSEIQFKGISQINSLNKVIENIELLDIIELDDDIWLSEGRNATIDEIIEKAAEKDPLPDISDFVEEYESLQIVNPTKAKFRDTTLNKTYYEMLRLYANELEKENSILFIMGFSMADEHIREITIRAIKSNPTLKVFICSYTEKAEDILANLKSDNVDLKNYHNVELIHPFDGFTLIKFNELLLNPLLENIKSC